MRPEPPAEVTELVAKPVELIKWLEQQNAEQAVRCILTNYY